MENIDGYDAILVRDQPRFRLNRVMVPAANVPKDIQEQLLLDLYTRRNEREAASAPQIEAGDFSIERTHPAVEADEKQVEEVMNNSEFNDMIAREGLVPTNDKMPSSFEMQLIEQLEDVKEQMAEFAATKERERMLPMAPQRMGIFDLAKELYARYGVYTVFVGEPPKDGDIHPFSGDSMTRYEVGLAYQKHTQALMQGKLNKDFVQQYDDVKASRRASGTHAAEMEQRAEYTPVDHARENTFKHRTEIHKVTSMHQKQPDGQFGVDEVTAEPNLRGQTIRPDW